FQQINHPCFDAIAPNKALLARAGGLCPCSPRLEPAGFLKVLFFGVPFTTLQNLQKRTGECPVLLL
ncbi:hypothetical protein, partial [Oscillatoria sp. HE19RPO]|uniref:hypothetical protein n=1 Tax=Oscillatoria sp. HE19RPO TaxID=2954806 RepID=UPI0020C2B565